MGMRCYQCGYDLSGHALRETCPECGRTIDGKRHSRLRFASWAAAALLVPPLAQFCLILLGLLCISTFFRDQFYFIAPKSTLFDLMMFGLVFGTPAVALIMTMAVLARWRPIRWSVLWALIVGAILGIVGIAGLYASFLWLMRDFD